LPTSWHFWESVVSIDYHLVNCWKMHFSFSIQHGLLKVAERALFLWNNDHIVNLIAHNRQVILPIIFPALDRNVQSHWNPAVVNLTHNIRKMFLEMDEKLFISCHNHFKEEEAILISTAEKRKEAWKQLEHAASLRPVIGNTAVLVSWLALRAGSSILVNLMLWWKISRYVE